MSKFKFLKVSKFKKLRFLSINQNSNLYIVFLHGFMSDIEGDKPKNFLKYCKKRKLGFLAIEYSGHGKSSGKFINGNISKWTKEVKIIILLETAFNFSAKDTLFLGHKSNIFSFFNNIDGLYNQN